MRDLAIARAPSASLGAGLYESHFLTAVDPAGGRALWLRHTTLKRPGEAARATVWLTWFDRAAPAPLPARVTAPDPLRGPGAAWSRSSLGEFGPGRARGAIAELAWDLSWESRAGELAYLPARWLYDRPVPRSNGVALAPAASVSGSIRVTADAPVVTLAGWEGMVGHNWGTEHAEQWSWLHAGGLGADQSGWIELILVRIRLGPLQTPWIAAGALCLDGRILTTARRGGIRRELDGEQTTVHVPMAAGRALELTVAAPANVTVSWDYASPRGPGRQVRNCSVADASLRLRTPNGDLACEVRGRFAVEHGATL
ncbi:MAG: hypothetical protein ACRDNK_04520 [Solirubrobacteraceae bacterium]